MTAISLDQIKSVFATTCNILDEDVLENLAHLCRIFNLSAERLHNKWEAFSMQSSLDQTKIENIALESFKAHLKASSEQGTQLGLSHKKTGKSLEAKSNHLSHLMDKHSFGKMLTKKSAIISCSKEDKYINKMETPVKFAHDKTFHINSHTSQFEDSPSIDKFQERTTSGRVECSFNSQLSNTKYTSNYSKDTKRCDIAIYPLYLLEDYKYMYDKIGARSFVIDRKIRFIQEIIGEENGFEMSVLEDPGKASQFHIKTIGKVMCDSTSKLNDKSVMFETNTDLGATYIHLDLNDVSQFTLFPGQVLGLEGVNNTGNDIFHVKKIIEPSLPDSECSSVKDLFEFNHGQKYLKNLPLVIISVAGPYNLEGHLNFDPLTCFISQARTSHADVILMMGPFITDDIMKNCASQSAFELFWKSFIIPLLDLLTEQQHLQIILVPSGRDIVHNFPVFPQPPFDVRKLLNDYHLSILQKNALERLICIPNPCVFAINELCFGICTDDTLMDLCKEEISRSSMHSEGRINRLIYQLLSQRSFYPLIPTGSFEYSVSVDYEKLNNTDLLVSPDVLILPSKLKCFATLVGKTISCNPGSLTRGQNGGTFAKMYVHPLDISNFSPQTNEEDLMYHSAESRVQINIIRI